MNYLEEAHAEINALGGADRPGSEYDRGYSAALDDALAAIERLQVKQAAEPLFERRAA